MIFYNIPDSHTTKNYKQYNIKVNCIMEKWVPLQLIKTVYCSKAVYKQPTFIRKTIITIFSVNEKSKAINGIIFKSSHSWLTFIHYMNYNK